MIAAGIPPLGTSWDVEKKQLPPLWPVMASCDFLNCGTAKRVENRVRLLPYPLYS